MLWLFLSRCDLFINHRRIGAEIQINSGTHASDKEGLAGIGFGSGIHDPSNWAIWIYALITEWLDYYKRVTFLSVHMPGHCRELGSFPEPMPVTKKYLPDLASVQASMTQVFGLFGSMRSSLNDFITISV